MQYLGRFKGVSIFPNKDAGYFTVRNSPSLLSGILVKSVSPLLATGNVSKELDGTFWVQVSANGKTGWAKSTAVSWNGKTSNKLVDEPAKMDFDPKLKGKTIRFLATYPVVNLREKPSLTSPIKKKLEAVSFGFIPDGTKPVGTATGNKLQDGKAFWLEIETAVFGSTKGWVRSDVVFLEGQSAGFSALRKTGSFAKEVVVETGKTVTEVASNFLLSPIGLVGLGVGIWFLSGKKK